MCDPYLHTQICWQNTFFEMLQTTTWALWFLLALQKVQPIPLCLTNLFGFTNKRTI
jgi:hypothetical protein